MTAAVDEQIEMQLPPHGATLANWIPAGIKIARRPTSGPHLRQVG